MIVPSCKACGKRFTDMSSNGLCVECFENSIDPMRFQVHYDTHYGIDHRKGWSIVWRGSVVVQLEKYLIVALWKAWRSVRKWER